MTSSTAGIFFGGALLFWKALQVVTFERIINRLLKII
jgi:hypothetical protein